LLRPSDGIVTGTEKRSWKSFHGRTAVFSPSIFMCLFHYEDLESCNQRPAVALGQRMKCRRVSFNRSDLCAVLGFADDFFSLFFREAENETIYGMLFSVYEISTL
jgi:hypothetical protein